VAGIHVETSAVLVIVTNCRAHGRVEPRTRTGTRHVDVSVPIVLGMPGWRGSGSTATRRGRAAAEVDGHGCQRLKDRTVNGSSATVCRPMTG
jgi:hypothetical protein